MTIKGESIKAIFTNLLFLIGVILIVVGFIRSTSTVVKFIVFDKYPLNSYEESRCEFNSPNYPKPVAVEGESQPVDTRTEAQIAECEESLEQDRKLRMVEDVTTSISFLISGIVISAVFRRFIFGKKE